MNERSIFLEALEQEDPTQRAAFLDAACAGNASLRQRIEALLQSHAGAGSFLGKLAPERVAEELAQQPTDDATQADAAEIENPLEKLGFLTPSNKPDSLGRLGHYEILEVIGQGGMGIVLRAFDDKLHRVVAIKVMAPELAATSPPRKRFLREARSAAQVRHEHVVDIHAVEEQPIPYLVMEYVAGETLQQKLDRIGPLESPEVLRLGQQIARGLAAAHERGLIHRDIKPANILLEKGVEERVKITDFGLARAVADVSLTQSGVIAGTPMYMAPEQTVGDTIDHRADLFSLGSVLYTMVSGRPPFRATTSMATLKRVAEDTPRPIREIIPEVPEWLCDIITKLHAKKPEDRFQTAKEVADVLGKSLTELQMHGNVTLDKARGGLEDKELGRQGDKKIAASANNGRDNAALSPCLEAPRPRGRRLAVAAAVLLCLVGGLSFTEGTGVTKLRSTVIRIFTPDGTLFVEVDDPGVKVTVEGDGGLVITGAGLEEIRLRPGSYKVHADRGGKPVILDRELVSIAKGGREVVKVKLEAPRAPVVAKTEMGAFVLLPAGKERKFDTLAEAMLGASDGDTVEVRGNGPFLTAPLHLRKRALTIRAGDGFRPVIKLSPEWAVQNVHLLDTQAALVLEGLELHRVRPGPDLKSYHHIIRSDGAPVRAANCRFVVKLGAFAVYADDSPLLDLRNCEFLLGIGGDWMPGHVAVHWIAPAGGRCRMQNCLTAGAYGLQLGSRSYPPKPASVLLAGNSLAGWWAPVLLNLDPSQEPPGGGAAGVFSIEASTNVFDGKFCLASWYFRPGEPPPTEAAFLRRSLTWKGDRNQFSPESAFTAVTHSGTTAYGIKDLTEWNRFWRQDDSRCRSGTVRYQGGDVRSRVVKAPEQLTPEDFRLRPDSPGYKADKGGKDLGADVDLVGPGPAYERWKKTPAYQQWLKDTGQLRAEAPKTERGAFVRLGGKGVAERKFDNMAEAVQPTSDGDTIEVRGNGPFVSQPIKVTYALCIRAGAGCRPVIQLSPEAIAEGAAPLR